MKKLLMLVLAFGVGAFGCGGDDDDDTAAPDTGMSTADAGTGKVGFGGCGVGTPFMDLTAAGASRMIATTATPSYSPKCIRVKKGQMVTIASEAFHPLTPAQGNPGTEIPAATANTTVTMNALGVHGFYCGNHGTTTGGGMSGAIEVVP